LPGAVTLRGRASIWRCRLNVCPRSRSGASRGIASSILSDLSSISDPGSLIIDSLLIVDLRLMIVVLVCGRTLANQQSKIINHQVITNQRSTIIK
jgi:hypothetical protein